jgi:hypothetical protein
VLPGDAWILDVRLMQWSQLPDGPKNIPRLWHTGTQSGDGAVTIFGGCIDDILHTELPVGIAVVAAVILGSER